MDYSTGELLLGLRYFRNFIIYFSIYWFGELLLELRYFRNNMLHPPIAWRVNYCLDYGTSETRP